MVTLFLILYIYIYIYWIRTGETADLLKVFVERTKPTDTIHNTVFSW